MVDHLLGYYVIAIILSTITALITIYHHQIVAKLTPVAHSVKTLPGGWSIPIAILFIISFPPVRHTAEFRVYPVIIMSRSYSVTKSLPFFAASFGVFGLGLPLLQLAHFLENWATFSACSVTGEA
jgi:hypothetical protein